MFLYDANGDKLHFIEYRLSAGFHQIPIEIVDQDVDPADCVGYQYVELEADEEE